MSIKPSVRRIRLAASPLMVAVALGLLGPAALEGEPSNSWRMEGDQLGEDLSLPELPSPSELDEDAGF